jgi:regulator of replication initiation timing
MRDELNYLHEELNKLEATNNSLVNELNMVRRENNDFKLQLYESVREKEQEQSQSKL